MLRPVRRSLPQTLTRAVMKAVAFTLAMLLSYVSSAVAFDMNTLAQGQQDDEVMVVEPAPGKQPSVSSEPGLRR